MESFISRHYTILFLCFLGIFGGLAFYAGRLEAGRGSNTAVILSCDESTISGLTIPTKALATNYKDDLSDNIIDKSSNTSNQTGKWVGSKNGTKYYTPGCAGMSRIKSENYVWFESTDDATVQGYSKGSC